CGRPEVAAGWPGGAARGGAGTSQRSEDTQKSDGFGAFTGAGRLVEVEFVFGLLFLHPGFSLLRVEKTGHKHTVISDNTLDTFGVAGLFRTNHDRNPGTLRQV